MKWKLKLTTFALWHWYVPNLNSFLESRKNPRFFQYWKKEELLPTLFPRIHSGTIPLVRGYNDFFCRCFKQIASNYFCSNFLDPPIAQLVERATLDQADRYSPISFLYCFRLRVQSWEKFQTSSSLFLGFLAKSLLPIKVSYQPHQFWP